MFARASRRRVAIFRKFPRIKDSKIPVRNFENECPKQSRVAKPFGILKPRCFVAKFLTLLQDTENSQKAAKLLKLTCSLVFPCVETPRCQIYEISANRGFENPRTKFQKRVSKTKPRCQTIPNLETEMLCCQISKITSRHGKLAGSGKVSEIKYWATKALIKNRNVSKTIVSRTFLTVTECFPYHHFALTSELIIAGLSHGIYCISFILIEFRINN